MHRIATGLLAIGGFLFAGCPNNDFREPPPPDQGAAPAREAPPGTEDHDQALSHLQEEIDAIEEQARQSLLPEQQEVDLPEGVPVPSEYVVVNHSQVGPMTITTIEVSEDLGSLVSRFNSELEDSEHEVEPIAPEESQDSDFQARGRVMIDNTRVTITIADARELIQEESTGTVTYQVTLLE